MIQELQITGFLGQPKRWLFRVWHSFLQIHFNILQISFCDGKLFVLATGFCEHAIALWRSLLREDEDLSFSFWCYFLMDMNQQSDVNTSNLHSIESPETLVNGESEGDDESQALLRSNKPKRKVQWLDKNGDQLAQIFVFEPRYSTILAFLAACLSCFCSILMSSLIVFFGLCLDHCITCFLSTSFYLRPLFPVPFYSLMYIRVLLR